MPEFGRPENAGAGSRPRPARGQSAPLTYKEAAEVVATSTLDVRKAAIFGEAMIVIVYLPILTLAGIEGKLFKPMALTVLFALLGAFVASLTFVPVLVATFLRGEKSHQEPFLVRLLQGVYPRLLGPVMAAPKRVMGAALVVLGLAAAAGSQMGAEFIPHLDEGSLALEVTRLPSVSLTEAIAGTTRFEKLMGEDNN